MFVRTAHTYERNFFFALTLKELKSLSSSFRLISTSLNSFANTLTRSLWVVTLKAAPSVVVIVLILHICDICCKDQQVDSTKTNTCRHRLLRLTICVRTYLHNNTLKFQHDEQTYGTRHKPSQHNTSKANSTNTIDYWATLSQYFIFNQLILWWMVGVQGEPPNGIRMSKAKVQFKALFEPMTWLHV